MKYGKQSKQKHNKTIKYPPQSLILGHLELRLSSLFTENNSSIISEQYEHGGACVARQAAVIGASKAALLRINKACSLSLGKLIMK